MSRRTYIDAPHAPQPQDGERPVSVVHVGYLPHWHWLIEGQDEGRRDTWCGLSSQYATARIETGMPTCQACIDARRRHEADKRERAAQERWLAGKRRPGIRERLKAARREGAEAMLSRVVEALEDRMLMHEATWQDAHQDQEDRNEALVRGSEARMCWHTMRTLEVHYAE